MTMSTPGLIHSTLARGLIVACGLAGALAPALAAAQGVTYGQRAYDYRNPPPEPAGQDDRDWQDGQSWQDGSNRQPAYSGQYASPQRNDNADAANWARDNCVKARGNAAGGAVVGGILGAIVGSALGGRHDHGAGTAAGAAIGAIGGAAVGDSSRDTSPGCPQGYVTRNTTTYAPRQPTYYATPAPYAGSVWYGETYPRAYWRPAPPRPVYRGGWGRPYGGYGGYGHGWGGHHRR